MLRGYRLIVLAFGLIVCGAQPPKEQAQGKTSAQPTEQAVTEPYAPYTGYNPAPCYQAKNHDAADLCAQWRASVAAEKAAHEARRATSWSIVATLLSFIGLCAIIFSLRQTNRALRIAQRDRATATRRAMAQAEETKDALASGRQSARSMAQVAKTLQAQSALVAKTAETSKRIADAQQDHAVMQMRAYLSVTVGAATFQERGRNMRFEARPQIINSGSTSARDLAFRIKAAILPYPPPENIQWDTPPISGEQGFIPPHQDRIMSATVSDFIEETMVHRTMMRDGLCLYVWGKVIYKDAFDNDRETNFGQSLYWLPDNEGKPTIIMGEYLPGMNDAT